MKRLLFSFFIALLINPILVQGQDSQAGDQSARIMHNKIADSLFVLSHGNTNAVLFIDSDYALMIDAHNEEAGSAAYRYAGRLSPLQPVKFVINTHYHADHTGGNKFFFDSGATIIANMGTYSNLLTSMNEDQIEEAKKQRAELKTALKLEGKTEKGQKLAKLLSQSLLKDLEKDADYPILTFSNNLNWELANETIDIATVSNGHTSEDSYVYFQNKNVIATGDLFFNGSYPFIDLKYGGTIEGYLKNIDALLGLCDDNTIVVPGHGPIASINDLIQYKRMIEYTWKGVSMDFLLNKTLDQVKANKSITAQFDAQGFGKGYMSTSKYVEMLYQEASKKYTKSKK